MTESKKITEIKSLASLDSAYFYILFCRWLQGDYCKAIIWSLTTMCAGSFEIAFGVHLMKKITPYWNDNTYPSTRLRAWREAFL